MADFTNLGFEEAGGYPGEAAGWTFSEVSTSVEYADLAGGTPASIGSIEDSGWLGTATFDVTGTPTGDYNVELETFISGVLGTPGTQIWYSLNGGANYSDPEELATSGVFVIGSSGMTITFGDNPGDTIEGALSWSTSGGTIGNSPRPLEDFELGWGADNFIYTIASGVYAAFDSAYVAPAPTIELFARWANPLYFYELVTSEVASFVGPITLELFETGWGLTTFETSLGSVDATSLTTFDTSPYDTSFGPGDTAAATFGDGTTTEMFTNIFVPFNFTAAAGTDVCTAIGHGRSNGDRVFLQTTHTLPKGLNSGVRLYLRDVTTDTFKLALTSGGAAIDIEDAGIGTHTVTGDPAVYWVDFL